VILETTEYKCLKSQYSVLFNEAQQIKAYLDEARSLLQTTKTVHLRHIEQMEVKCTLFMCIEQARVGYIPSLCIYRTNKGKMYPFCI